MLTKIDTLVILVGNAASILNLNKRKGGTEKRTIINKLELNPS